MQVTSLSKPDADYHRPPVLFLSHPGRCRSRTRLGLLTVSIRLTSYPPWGRSTLHDCLILSFPARRYAGGSQLIWHIKTKSAAICYPLPHHAVGRMYPLDLSDRGLELLSGSRTTRPFRRMDEARICRAGPYSPPLYLAGFLRLHNQSINLFRGCQPLPTC